MLEKIKAVLTPYQDVLVFSTFKDIKMVCVLTFSQYVFSALKDIKQLDNCLGKS